MIEVRAEDFLSWVRCSIGSTMWVRGEAGSLAEHLMAHLSGLEVQGQDRWDWGRKAGYGSRWVRGLEKIEGWVGELGPRAWPMQKTDGREVSGGPGGEPPPSGEAASGVPRPMTIAGLVAQSTGNFL